MTFNKLDKVMEEANETAKSLLEGSLYEEMKRTTENLLKYVETCDKDCHGVGAHHFDPH